MKKQLLFVTILSVAIGSFSQNSQPLKPMGMIDSRLIATNKFGNEQTSTISNKQKAKPFTFPSQSASKTSVTATWQVISSSMNIYGVTLSYCKPLQWNDELNAVSFIHRKSPTYSISPLPSSVAETGDIVAMVSTNCGATWDSTAIYSDDNFWGRYPGGAIYNPPSTPLNIDINKAYIVGAGPTEGAGIQPWMGNWYTSKKLGGVNYNNAPSTIPNAQQVMPSGGPFSLGVPSRHDFSAYGFTATDDGKMKVLAGIRNDALEVDTAIMLMTGIYTNGVFAWSGKVFDPPTTKASDGSDNLGPRYTMAWNESGTVGYIVTIGAKLGATGSNTGLQPIVYKTTNSGSTWSLESAINFNLPGYNSLKKKLWSVNADPDLVVPNFLWMEGFDAAVDANGKLHLFTTLVGHLSNDADSLNFVAQWSSEKYLWPHEVLQSNSSAIHPYLWDFVYSGTNASPKWSYRLIDSMATEGPGGSTTDAGYQDNPWDMNPSGEKVRVDARLQMSRTPDGKHLLYTWTDSDSAFTENQKKWNNIPNIKARLYDADIMALSPTKLDVTVNSSGDVANRALCHFVSPKFKLVAKNVSAINVEVPMTISNSNPYGQLTTNTHWYSCAGLSFVRPQYSDPIVEPDDVGIADNNAISAASSYLYPNPAKNNVTVGLNLVSASNVQIEVLNTIGQTMKTLSSQCQVGENAIAINLEGLAKGIYFVNIKIDNASSNKKLVIE